MELKQYQEELQRLQEEFEKKKIDLMKSYVIANNTHKIGDIITDSTGSIQIEGIRFNWGEPWDNKPFAVYIGTVLKKDGTPRKDGEKRIVHQHWVIK